MGLTAALSPQPDSSQRLSLPHPVCQRTLSDRPLRQHSFHARKLPRKPLQKCLQSSYGIVTRSLRMQAYRPKAIPLLHRSPKLQRNPDFAPIPIWPTGKSIRDHGDPFLPQHLDRVPVESMPRRSPNPRLKPMPAQDSHSSPHPLPLRLQRCPGKLRQPMQRHQPSAFRHAQMLISMQRNRRSCRLQVARFIPKRGILRRYL